MRKTALLLGAMLLAMLAASGAAWAATTQCPNDPAGHGGGTCWGTRGDDLIIGTDRRDEIQSSLGDDVVRAGGGDDLISNDESDSPYGEDENHGGAGPDKIVGNLDSEKHFGGRGNDVLVDVPGAPCPGSQ